MERPEETEQTKIASFLLVPQDLAGCVGDPGASGVCRVRADSGQLAQQAEAGQPRDAISHPAAPSALLDRDKSPQQSQAFLHPHAFVQAHLQGLPLPPHPVPHPLIEGPLKILISGSENY